MEPRVPDRGEGNSRNRRPACPGGTVDVTVEVTGETGSRLALVERCGGTVWWNGVVERCGGMVDVAARVTVGVTLGVTAIVTVGVTDGVTAGDDESPAQRRATGGYRAS